MGHHAKWALHLGLTLGIPLVSCAPSPSTLNNASQSTGNLSLQIQWPQSDFKTQVIPVETQTLEFEIQGKGLQGPLRKVLQRRNNVSEISETVTLPVGEKNVSVKAFDANKKLLALDNQTIEIRAGQRSRLVMELKPLGPSPLPSPVATNPSTNIPVPVSPSSPQPVGSNAPLPSSSQAPLPIPAPIANPNTAPQTLPGPPTNLHLVEQTTHSLVIQWTFDAQARSHKIFKDGQLVAENYTYPNFYRFEGLTPGQNIRVEIRSVNAFGESSAAQISASTTLQGQTGSGGFGGGGGGSSAAPEPILPSASPTPQNLPTLTAFSPFEGTKGHFVTLQGANLAGATAVHFNGIPASFVVDENGLDLVATVPNNPAASGTISVTTPQGSANSAGSFSYLQNPFITQISPVSGGNNTQVTLTGLNFTGVNAVQFNGVNATNYTFNNDTEIVATVPNNPAANGILTVSNGFGTSTQTLAFNWLAAPTIGGFTPTSGGPSTSVTITGSNFQNASAVRFNGHDAESYTVDSDTQITAVVPANQPAATGPVSVVTAGGTATSAGNFSLTTPVVGGFVPTTAAAGTAVTITGTNFTGATAVQFNGIAALNYTVNSNTQITATVPNNAGASGSITVTTPGGSNALAGFTWNAPVTANPIISSSNFTTGGVGQWITLTGLNFTGTTGATFNGTAVASFTVVNDTTLRLRVPIGATTGQIAVTNASGTGTSAFNYTVTPYRTWFVKAGASGSGGDWQDAMGSLSSALTSAAPVAGTEIWVAAGTYKPHASNRSISFQLKSNVAVYGGFAGIANETSNTMRNWSTNLTNLSGDLAGNDSAFTNNTENAYTVVTGANNAVLDGFRIMGGNSNTANPDSTSQGGGIYLLNTTGIQLRNLSLFHNQAQNGGAIYQNGGTSVLKNVSLAYNKTISFTSTSISGGGMKLINGGQSSLENVTFNYNESSVAGGLDVSQSSTFTTIGNNNVFINNRSHSLGGGGALRVSFATINVSGLRFSNNTAYNGPGGAIHLDYSGVATLTNSIINNNSNTGTGYGGGGIHINGSGVGPGVLNLHRSVLANNSSGIAGSAIWQGVGGVADINNSVIANNPGSGLVLTGAWTMKHNTIYSTTLGPGSTSGTRILRNCIFWQPTATAMMGGLVTYNINNSVLRTNTGYTLTGTNNTTSDPLFVNAADPDGADNLWFTADDGLRLQAGSSALGRAISDLLSPDIAGQTRVNPGDSGAYERP
ncbi:MAG: IPT/TIG domain-containing protein [Candidatus Sericytochromatia bacterium]